MRTWSATLLILLGLLGLFTAPSETSQIQIPRILIVRDYTDSDDGAAYQQTHDAISALGWSVGEMRWSKLSADAVSLSVDWDVIWVLPCVKYQHLRRASRAGGALDAFTEGGGIVVLPGVGVGETRIDVAPGGIDVLAHPAPGSIAILDSAHSLIAGTGTGGAPLTVAHLDPQGTGGQGSIAPLPPELAATIIAQNSIGPVLLEYARGSGLVIVSLLDLLGAPCLDNVLAYVHSLVTTP